MEDRTNQLVQAYDSDGNEKGLFRLLGNNCPLDHLEEVIKDYFEHLDEGDEENADLSLFRWGLERVYIDYSINL